MTERYSQTSALVIVDLQHDFADPTGSLYVTGGEQLLAPIVEELHAAQQAGATIAYTQDWHPEHTPHFAQDGGIWPVHCVMGTHGAQFVPGLPVAGPVVRKGSGPEDGYSAFSVLDLNEGSTRGTELSDVLDENGVLDVVIVGLAGDWCVKESSIDAVRLGYQARVPLALTRFVELIPGDKGRAIEAMRAAGVTVEN